MGKYDMRYGRLHFNTWPAQGRPANQLCMYIHMYGRALRTAAGSRVVRVNDAQVGKVIFQVR